MSLRIVPKRNTIAELRMNEEIVRKNILIQFYEKSLLKKFNVENVFELIFSTEMSFGVTTNESVRIRASSAILLK